MPVPRAGRTIRGQVSMFGGPSDSQDNGTTASGFSTLQNPNAPYVALPVSLAKQWGVHRRWNTPVNLFNPQTGKRVTGYLKDIGPAGRLGRVADVSPSLMKQLGGSGLLNNIEVSLDGVDGAGGSNGSGGSTMVPSAIAGRRAYGGYSGYGGLAAGAASAQSNTPNAQNPDMDALVAQVLQLIKQRQAASNAYAQVPAYNPDAHVTLGIPGYGPSDRERYAAAQRDVLTGNAQVQSQDAIDAAQAEKAALDAQIAARAGLQPAQRQFAPYTPPPMPERQGVPYPERVQPRVDPGVALASGLLSVLAPRGAGQFGTAALRGAADKAGSDYADRLARFKYAVENANTAYGDKLRGYEQQTRLGQENLRGSEEANYGNALNRYNNDVSNIPLQGQAASLVSKLGTDKMPGSLSRRSDALRTLSNREADVGEIGSKINAGLSQNAAAMAAREKSFEDAIKAIGEGGKLLSTQQKSSQFDQRMGLEQNKFGFDQGYKNSELRINQQKADADTLRANKMANNANGADGNGAAKVPTGTEVQSAYTTYQKAIKNRLDVDARLKEAHPDWSNAQRFADPQYKVVEDLETRAAQTYNSMRDRRYPTPAAAPHGGLPTVTKKSANRAAKKAPAADPLGIR